MGEQRDRLRRGWGRTGRSNVRVGLVIGLGAWAGGCDEGRADVRVSSSSYSSVWVCMSPMTDTAGVACVCRSCESLCGCGAG